MGSAFWFISPPRAHFWPILSQEKCRKNALIPCGFVLGWGWNMKPNIHLYKPLSSLALSNKDLLLQRCLQIGIAINWSQPWFILFLWSGELLQRTKNVSKHYFSPVSFLSDPGLSTGPIYGSSLCNSLSERGCWNFTDVTAADEDTNSILTDKVNRTIQGNVAKQL